jgi:hypothetical protein
MSKIQVTLDANKLRNLVSQRSYKNREGQDVVLQEVKFELVPVKEPKTIYTADTYRIDKTHFAAVIQTKEERANKAPTVYIGEGFTTVWANATPEIKTHQAEIISINDPNDDIPF